MPGKLANPRAICLAVPVAIVDAVVDKLRPLLQSGGDK